MSIRTGVVAVILAFITLINAGCAVNSHQSVAVSHHQPVAVIHVDDHAITMTIQVNFSQNNLLSQSNITVESLYGVVLLSGMVKTEVEKTTAQTLAENVDGVKAVHNAIEIQPITSEDWQPRRTDRQLISSTSDAQLTYHPTDR